MGDKVIEESSNLSMLVLVMWIVFSMEVAVTWNGVGRWPD